MKTKQIIALILQTLWKIYREVWLNKRFPYLLNGSFSTTRAHALQWTYMQVLHNTGNIDGEENHYIARAFFNIFDELCEIFNIVCKIDVIFCSSEEPY